MAMSLNEVGVPASCGLFETRLDSVAIRALAFGFPLRSVALIQTANVTERAEL